MDMFLDLTICRDVNEARRIRGVKTMTTLYSVWRER